MSRILLTGGTGYIGSHIAVCVQSAEHDVVLLDNFTNSDIETVEHIEKISGMKPALVVGDVRDTELLTATMNDYEVDAVIHLAGLKSVEESVAEPERYYDNNIAGTESLVSAMEQAGVYSLVFSSSATVYGIPQYLPLDEEHPVGWVNPYAETKVKVEQMLAAKCQADPRWHVVSLRYFNPVGSHNSGLLGDNAKALRANLMPMIARVGTGKLPHLAVYGNDYDTPDGTCLRDYIHIMDLAEGHVSTLNNIDRFPGYCAINLGTGEGISVLQMVRAFEAVSGRKIALLAEPRRIGDVPVCYANCDKARDMLGWQSSRDLNAMCASVWHWCQQLES